jgi:hypothetical protein
MMLLLLLLLLLLLFLRSTSNAEPGCNTECASTCIAVSPRQKVAVHGDLSRRAPTKLLRWDP